MAGNKTIYDTAMKRAHEYAWANQWERAMKEYGRALLEFPGDRTAQRNLAQCQFRLRQWPEALAAYQSLLSLDPGDAFAINRLAEIYLALSQQENARTTYNNLADLYVKNNQIYEAIRALRDYTRAVPKNKEAHERLLDLTQQMGDNPAQAAQHLALSQIALDHNNLGEAMQHADAAAALDSEDLEIRRWLHTVRRRVAEAVGTVSLDGVEDIAGMMASATHRLREAEPEPPEAVALVLKAAEASEAGDYRLSLDLYDQAVRAGARQPSTFYSAGVLNQQMGRPENAVPFLERALQDPEFAMSANYVLGQCFMEMRNPSKAVTAFERALTLVELDKLTRAEADELIELYKSAADAHLADNNPGRAASLYSTLASTFKTHKWAHPRLADIEKRADELYNKSIQSKLLGISRGSVNLDPAKAPVEGPRGTSVISDKEVEQPTLMLATSGTGTMSGNAPAAPAAFPAASTNVATAHDQATTLMNKPGSNLRSITEYLRAADGTVQEVREEGGGTVALPHVAPTEKLPPPNSVNDPHVVVDLPDSALDDKEEQRLETQLIIAEGEHAMAEGLWSAAVDSCWMIIRSEPYYLPIHMMLGDIYLHQGKAEDAVAKYQAVMDTYMARQDSPHAAEVCERLLHLQPDNPALQTRLGVLLLEAGRVDDAAKALLAVAERYHQAGDTEMALDEALSLKDALPNSSEVALQVGTYHELLGQVPEAVSELSRALQLNPGNDTALIRLYVCLTETDDPAQWDALQSVLERAAANNVETRQFMEELHKGIKRHNLAGLYYALAVIASRSGLDDIAADALDQGILSISLGDTSTLTPSTLFLEAMMAQTRADMAINAKEWGLAVRHYSRALELLKPGSEGAVDMESPRPQYDFARLADPVQLYYGLAEAHASQNNWEGALQALKSLKNLMPEDHGVHTRLADLYFRQGKLTEALSELNDLLVNYQKANENDKTLETLGHMARLAPNNVAVRRKLSDLYLKLGMTEQGMTELNTLAELQLKAGLLKDAMRTYQKAADLHHTLGQNDKAINIYERIVRIAPRDLTARDQLVNMYIMTGKVKEAVASERALAELFVQEGRTEEAIAALHQLIALSPDDQPGLLLLAKQLTSIGEYGQAARLYGRLSRMEPDNEDLQIRQIEMQKLADQAEEAKKEAKAARRAAKEAVAST